MPSNDVNDDREVENAKLLKALDAWRNNRELYPGWLVAPTETRSQIWARTSDWLLAKSKRFGLIVANDWSAGQKLILFRELVWRMEICLLPLPDDYVDDVQNVLNEMRGILFGPDVGDPSVFSEEIAWPDSLKLSSSALREDFQALQLSLLRSYRIRPDIEAFEQCALDIEACARPTADTIAHLQYQRCLKALAELDREATRVYLEHWPNETIDPYWLVRKAAIFCELGDMDKAKSLAEDSLKQIRTQRRHDGTGFYALSREGWCRRFLWQIEASENLRAEGIPERLIRDLERSRCSPDRELSGIADRLKGRIPPKPKPLSQWGEPNFENGDRSETHLLGWEHPYLRLSQAMEQLFIIEETGVPPVLEGTLTNTTFMGNAEITALSWVQLELPGIWSAFALRFNARGLVAEKNDSDNRKSNPLRRATIAALPKAHLGRLFSAIMFEIERLTSVPVSSGKRDLFQIRDFFDAATRLTYCLGDEERERALTIALRLVREEWITYNPIGFEVVWKTVKRLVPYLHSPLIQKWMPKLLFQFPLETNASGRSLSWPLITEHMRISAGEFQRPDDEAFRLGVSDLIKAISNPDIMMRTDAALRLLSMYEWGLLTNEETSRYKEDIWRKTDSNRLPKISDNVLINIHLEWPRFADRDVIDGIKMWIEFGRVEDRYMPPQSINEDGKTRRSISSRDPDLYLTQVRFLLDTHTKEESLLLNFLGPKQYNHIFRAILDWWDREKESYEEEAERNSSFVIDPFDRFYLVFEILLFCCLQSKIAIAEKRRVFALIDDYERLVSQTPHSLMVRAALDPKQLKVFWQRARHDVWNNDPNSGTNALRAILTWESARLLHNRNPVPKEVLTAVAATLTDVSISAFRSMNFIAAFLKLSRTRDRIADIPMLSDFVDAAANRLSYEDSESFNVSSELRPHLRRRLAHLIYTMKDCGLPLGEPALHWIESAEHDPFIDVRLAVEGNNVS